MPLIHRHDGGYPGTHRPLSRTPRKGSSRSYARSGGSPEGRRRNRLPPACLNPEREGYGDAMEILWPERETGEPIFEPAVSET